MATRYAVASGNWSAPATWDGGVSLPGVSDDVYADGKTVTIDQDVSVRTLRNDTRSGGTNGGGFLVTTTRTITASVGIYAENATSGTLLDTINFTGGAGTLLTINATVNGATANTFKAAVYHNGAGTITINGNIVGPYGNANGTHTVWGAAGCGALNINGNLSGYNGSTAGNWPLNWVSTSQLTIVGNISNGSYNSAGGYVVYIGAVCTVNITGNVTGGAINGHTVYGIYCNFAANITITGTVSSGQGSTGTPQAAYGNAGIVFLASGGTLTINGPVYGTEYGVGVWAASNGGGNTGPMVYMTGPFYSSSLNSLAPFACLKWRLTDLTDNFLQARDSSGNAVNLVTADALPSVPNASDVRLGVSFGSGLTGTCAVPTAADVAHGVAVDNTTGTAALKLTDVAALVGAQIAGALST